MSIYCRYKSGVETFSIPVPSHVVSVAEVKRLIAATGRHGHGRTRGRQPREEIALSNALTGEDYADESALIAQNSTVLVHRVAGCPTDTIVVFSSRKVIEDGSLAPNKSMVTESATVSSSTTEVEDEEAEAIRAVIDAAELTWEDTSSGKGHASGRLTLGHRYGRGPWEGETPPPGYVCYNCHVKGHFIQHCPLERKAPPPGYVCRRCQVSGHFIQLCPTNGDRNFDFKRTCSVVPVVSPSTVDGIPAELVPAMSVSVVDDLPAELHCQLCKKAMIDAVLTSKCCFDSFCDRCIRDYLIARSMCVCGRKTLADDLIPNQTLRSTINNMLASRTTTGTSSGTWKLSSSTGSNACLKSQSQSDSAASKEVMEQGMGNLSSVTPEDSHLVIAENNLTELPREIGTYVDIESKTGDSASLSAMKILASVGSTESVPEIRDQSESTSKGNAVSGVLEPKVDRTKQSKMKQTKGGSSESGHHDSAQYDYSLRFDRPCYNPYYGGLPWGADPNVYHIPGMRYGGCTMPAYDLNAIGNLPSLALGMQAYPFSYYSSGGFQTRDYQDAEAAEWSRQTERPRDAGIPPQSSQRRHFSNSTREAESRIRSSERSHPTASTHRTESRDRTTSDPKRQDSRGHDRASNDSDKQRHSRKRIRASPLRDAGDRGVTGTGLVALPGGWTEDSGDEERNFKRRWGCRSSVTFDTRS